MDEMVQNNEPGNSASQSKQTIRAALKQRRFRLKKVLLWLGLGLVGLIVVLLAVFMLYIYEDPKDFSKLVKVSPGGRVEVLVPEKWERAAVHSEEVEYAYALFDNPNSPEQSFNDTDAYAVVTYDDQSLKEINFADFTDDLLDTFIDNAEQKLRQSFEDDSNFYLDRFQFNRFEYGPNKDLAISASVKGEKTDGSFGEYLILVIFTDEEVLYGLTIYSYSDIWYHRDNAKTYQNMADSFTIL